MVTKEKQLLCPDCGGNLSPGSASWSYTDYKCTQCGVLWSRRREWSPRLSPRVLLSWPVQPVPYWERPGVPYDTTMLD
jgi:tRNA(Ile2) C34 agmatinyltransferase TiaS